MFNINKYNTQEAAKKNKILEHKISIIEKFSEKIFVLNRSSMTEA